MNLGIENLDTHVYQFVIDKYNINTVAYHEGIGNMIEFEVSCITHVKWL